MGDRWGGLSGEEIMEPSGRWGRGDRNEEDKRHRWRGGQGCDRQGSQTSLCLPWASFFPPPQRPLPLPPSGGRMGLTSVGFVHDFRSP